jgi:predicted SAM-dependent methyltransferase
MTTNFSHEFYAETFSDFANRSDHTEQIIKILTDFTTNKLSNKDRLLDIGSASGKIAKALSSHFNHITLIEPNNEYENSYAEIKNHTLFKSTFDEFSDDNKYDLILCSHILYHVERGNWLDFIKKIHDYLAPNGKAVIIMIAERGDNHKVYEKINKNYGNSQQVKDRLSLLNINYDMMNYVTTYKTSDYDRIKCLLNFFFIDNSFSSFEYANLSGLEKQNIDSLVDEHILNHKIDDYYVYQEEVDILIISK